MKNFTMLRWWVIFWSSIISAGIIQYKGLFVSLWFADLSGVSFITLGLYFILTLFIGFLTNSLSRNEIYSIEHQNNLRYLQGCWYGSELLMACGMAGTLIGFTLMLGPALAGLDPSNLIATKAGIFNMAAGMSTAVLTTLVGLITSHMLKIQLINIEMTLREEDNES